MAAAAGQRGLLQVLSLRGTVPCGSSLALLAAAAVTILLLTTAALTSGAGRGVAEAQLGALQPSLLRRQGCTGTCGPTLGRGGWMTRYAGDGVVELPAAPGSRPQRAAPGAAAGPGREAGQGGRSSSSAQQSSSSSTQPSGSSSPPPPPAAPAGGGGAQEGGNGSALAGVEVFMVNRHFWGAQEQFRGVPTPCQLGGAPLPCRWGNASHGISPDTADALWFFCPSKAYPYALPGNRSITLPRAGAGAGAGPLPGKALIAACRESTANIVSMGDEGFVASFDYRMTYRRDSDAPLLYPPWDVRRQRPGTLPGWEARKGALAYINSNCRPKNGRDDIVRALAFNHSVPVDALGKCLHNTEEPVGRAAVRGGPGEGVSWREWALDKVTTMRSYRVCVAMENSNVHDYVTEKVWHALEAGCVPVYLGAPNARADFLPASDSVIWVEDYASTAQLAAEVRRVLSDRAAWERYNAWRSRPWEELSPGYRALVERRGLGDGASASASGEDYFELGRCRVCQLLAARRGGG